jgi:hypothetical protein
MEELDIEALKAEATDLGITFPQNIGAEKLKAKIDAFYESQETSEKETKAIVEANEQLEEKSAESDKLVVKPLGSIAAEAKTKAYATRVVTIIDNDQRVNNETTTCKVNCSNMFFDLGQIILPLNIPVEVRQGHINVLKEVKIPRHVQVGDNLSAVKLVERYSISYEDMKA